MKKKSVFVAVAMLLAIGSARAEVSTVVKSVTTEAVTAAMGMPCYVRTRELHGLLADAGIKIAESDNANCQLNVDGFISVVLNGNDYISKMPVDWFAEHQDNPEFVTNALPESAKDVLLALNNLVVAEDKASSDAAADAKLSEAERYAKHNGGSGLGGSIGGNFGLVGALGGILFGSMFDSSKGYETPAGLTHLTADIAIKNGGGQLEHFKVEVYAASTAKERPIDLLRAAVKRVVAEINKAGTPATVAVTHQEVQK